MMNGDPSLRCYKLLGRDDLLRLLRLAQRDRLDFFDRYPTWGRLYRNRVLCTALCQGAALHYMDPTVGINDFDIYSFYSDHPDRQWYAKRLQPVDYGDPKFGVSEISPKHYIGRRVDLMSRALDASPGTDPFNAITAYLRSGRTRTARELAANAVVLLEPVEKLGKVVWPTNVAIPQCGIL